MATDLKTICKLEVPVIVQVGQHRVSMDEILALSPGTILELEKSAEEELTLLINNKPIGRGEAVKVGENFGIRISHIGTTAERVEALGGDQTV